MSKFKRSFLSPRAFYKSVYIDALGDPPGDHKQVRASSQVSSLHLCRRSSIACDNVEMPKENRPPPPPPSSAGTTIQKAVLADTVDDDGKICFKICGVCPKGEEESLRQPLQPLTARKPCNKQLKTLLPCPEPTEIDHSTPLFAPPTPNRPLHIWDDDPNCDAAPASSWSTLANRSLLYRPLPLDVGRCACYILHEREAGADSPIVYSLYTDEGYGRQDRKLAVARHRRQSGRSEFIIGQNGVATSMARCEDGCMGRVRANLVGTRYFIWEESGGGHECRPRQLLGAVLFEPTVTTLTGTFRVMRAYIPKYQSLLISNNNQHEPIGLAKDWAENCSKVHQLCSRKPYYNRETKRYELDFRDRTRCAHRIKTSAKNFQLILEEHGKQVILMHGKVANCKYIMEYRFPLTAFQAFSICLASIDSKLCCSV